MLRSRFTEMIGLDHPIMSAPIWLHSGARLAGSVSAAVTDRPFGVGFITAFLAPFAGPPFEAALAEGSDVVALSFGDPPPWPDEAKAAGTGVMSQVQSNAFTEGWAGRDEELRGRREEFAQRSGTNPFENPPDPDRDEVLYGQSAAFVPAVRPAAEVVRTVSDDAEAILRSRPSELLR